MGESGHHSFIPPLGHIGMSFLCTMAGVLRYMPVTILAMSSRAREVVMMSEISSLGTEGKALATSSKATYPSPVWRLLVSLVARVVVLRPQSAPCWMSSSPGTVAAVTIMGISV